MKVAVRGRERDFIHKPQSCRKESKLVPCAKKCISMKMHGLSLLADTRAEEHILNGVSHMLSQRLPGKPSRIYADL